MVLSPEELEKRVENMISIHFNNIAAWIDRRLEDARLEGALKGTYSFAMPEIKGESAIKSLVLGRVLEAYSKAGWNVRYTADQKELIFDIK